MTPKKICFIDTETTGLDTWRGHEPWEIAAIIRMAGASDREIVWQVEPNLPLADPTALKIGRYHERYTLPQGFPAGRIHPNRVALTRDTLSHELRETLADAHLVGAQTWFDTGMLIASLIPEGVWHHRLICVENMAAPLLGWPLPRSLSATAEALGIPVDPAERHTALGDTKLTRDVYDAIQARIRQ